MHQFEVDLEGMRELYGSRPPWLMAKELVVNVFDEFRREDVPDNEKPTRCEILIEPDGDATFLTISDDGPGFSDLKDVYTLFGTTPKRAQLGVAGRFNLGEKEVIALAERASITTKTGTVSFENGQRTVNLEAGTDRGTIIHLLLPWDDTQRQQLVEGLKHLNPPDGLRVEVSLRPQVPYTIMSRTPYRVVRVSLETVIQEALGQPMKTTWRVTNVEIRQASGEHGWLCELGCPVQEIEAPYDVDVQQKIPLSPSRDKVSLSYLKSIYIILLNELHKEISEDDAGAGWTKMALESSYTTVEALKSVVVKRYGTDRVLLRGQNRLSNERAIEAGYQIISGYSLSKEEREVLDRIGIQHTSDVFRLELEHGEAVEITPELAKIRQYAQLLARSLLDLDIDVQFYSLKEAHEAAQMSGLTLGFNVGVLGIEWFKSTRPEVTELILHELAHVGDLDTDVVHGRQYVDRLAALAARAIHLDSKEWVALRYF